jgi:hypothetical protein
MENELVLEKNGTQMTLISTLILAAQNRQF